MTSYDKGPVRLRRGRIPSSTTDQRLLDQRGPTDWVHTDPWRVLRIQAEFVEGFGALAELGPAVGVFGSARTKPSGPGSPSRRRSPPIRTPCWRCSAAPATPRSGGCCRGSTRVRGTAR